MPLIIKIQPTLFDWSFVVQHNEKISIQTRISLRLPPNKLTANIMVETAYLGFLEYSRSVELAFGCGIF